jgi:predicted MFS family arabinose efflux permease
MQGLMLVNNVTLIAINGLAGFQLASNKALATLPITAYVLGGAVWSMPAAAFMKRYGRRAGYQLGALIAMFGAALGWFALNAQSLELLCLATFITGAYNAFGASLRFAAADVADAYRPDFKARAMSLVLTGGIAGGIVGPEVSKWSKGALSTPFAGTYLTLVGFALLSMLLSNLLRLPDQKTAQASGPARPLREILKQPTCWVAILCASLSYGVMNLLMVATPLAMEVCRFPFESTARVLEWHIVGMFAPGLFTGSLIQRFGVTRIIMAGCLLMIICVIVALQGVELFHFTIALFLLGVGWNFMYTGGSNLLTAGYLPQEKNKVQGFMDSCVFGVMITSSAASGALIFSNGWALLNIFSLPFILIILLVMVWYWLRIVPAGTAARA